MANIELIVANLPQRPGVYQFYDRRGQLLYIGKAVDLKRRVASYFQKAQSGRTARLVELIAKIKIIETTSSIEALVLEANLINKHQPPYNILLKDDKTWSGIFVSAEPYPRVFSARVTEQLPKGEWFGPYVYGKQRLEALKVLRRIFKWCDAPGINSKFKSQKLKLQFKNQKLRPCFYYHIKLCSGACVGAVTRQEYRSQINHLKMFLRGQKERLTKKIEREMKTATKVQKFEQAGRLKNELAALTHIRESALVALGDASPAKAQPKLRIEGFDVANISHDAIVGALVVNDAGKAVNSDYRQFKIRTVTRQNDVAALAEMLERRFQHLDWPLPDLVLVDGGLGQVNAARQVLHRHQLALPLVGIAKGPDRAKNQLVGDVAFVTQQKISLQTLIATRDEAHRFARRYFFTLRRKNLLGR